VPGAEPVTAPRYRLILCTDGRAAREPAAWRARIGEALDAATDAPAALWLREPELEVPELVTLARDLADACAPRRIALLVGDRADVALCAGPAVGVHLPSGGLPPADARALLGPDRPLGRSCHLPDEVLEVRGVVDHATLSPIWPTDSKPSAPALGPGAIEACRGGAPVFALGGVTPERVGAALAAGAWGVAARGAAFSAHRPARAVAALLDALRAAENL